MGLNNANRLVKGKYFPSVSLCCIYFVDQLFVDLI